MFNMEDKQLIKRIIDSREPENILIPVYLAIGNKKYSLLETNKILSCSQSIFKIGFGTSINVFIHNKFDKRELINMHAFNSFTEFDEDKQLATEYLTFESGDIPSDDKKIYNEINDWYFLLFDYVMEIVNKNRKELIKKSMEENS